MFLYSLTSVVVQFYALAPSGQQLGKAAKAAKGLIKEAPKFADDVVRVATKNKGFFASIPVWVWVIVGIVVVAGVIYYIEEEC